MISRLVVTAFVLTTFASAQSDALDRSFSDLQRAWRAGDGTAAGKIFSDQLSFITRSGVALKKQELLRSFKPGGGTMEKIAEKQMQVYGDCAVVTFKDGEGDLAARRTIVWHKTEAGWIVVSMQTTPIRP